MWKTMLRTFLVTGLLLSFVCVAAHASQVDSADIVVADGISGQDTFSGNGVKTDHIQDGAVTSAKLADAIVTEAKLVDGAVTDAKISGQISASKVATVGLDADSVDGIHAFELASAQHSHQEYTLKPYNVLTVALSGGDFTSIQTAIDSVTPTEESPVLIRVMPGIYTENIVMKSYVQLEGSGAENTTIKALNTNDNVILCSHIKDYVIKGLEIMGGSNGVRIEYTSAYGRVEGNRVHSNLTAGISSYIGNWVSTVNNEVFGNVYGIVYGTISNGKITNNKVYNNSEVGIYCSTIDNNTFVVSNRAYGNKTGIKINDGSTVSSNIIYKNYQYGISVSGSNIPQMISYNYIVGNSIYDFYSIINLLNCSFNFNTYNTIGGGGAVNGGFNATSAGAVAPTL